MSDLIRQLRNAMRAECDEAADEIERLRAALAITPQTGNSATAPASGITSQSGDLKQAAERKAFEAWAFGLKAEERYDFDSEGRGYKKDHGSMMWAAWQSRAALAAEPRVEFNTEDPPQSHSMSIAEAARILAEFFQAIPGGMEELRGMTQLAAPVVPDGWQWVPVEMTERMEIAAALAHEQSKCHDHIGPITDAWSAALAAAPTPSQTGEQR